jgi:hypothetical protein
MVRATLSAGLAGILGLGAAGCRGDLEYAQAFVARGSTGPVLMVLDRWKDGYTRLTDVDLATGARGYPQVIGVDAACLPAQTGKIWCGYSTGDNQYAHEQWVLGSWDVLADNDGLAQHGPLSSDQIQSDPGLTVRKTDRALVLSGDSGDTWTVDPGSLKLAPWTDYHFEDEEAVTAPDEASQGVRAYVDLGGNTYSFDFDLHLQVTPTGTSTPTVLDPTTAYYSGLFVVTDSYDPASPPLVPDGTESLVIVSMVDYDAGAGWQVTRVGTADGKPIWRVPVPDAQGLDTVVGSGGVLAASFPTTPWTSEMPPPPRHARVQGFDLATGAVRWTLHL